MSRASVNGVEIEYEVWGVENGQPLLLVGGLGSQLLTWPELLVQALVDTGFFVIAFSSSFRHSFRCSGVSGLL